MIILSGGDLGGQEVQWEYQGTLSDGREFMIISGYKYAKISETIAILYNIE
jgi:hypothetical protein